MTKMVKEKSQIASFYKDQTVFITGGSGFLGKVIIEKLLRACEDIKKIYVMIRPKKEKTPKKRFEEFFNYLCFDNLKCKNPNSLKKVCLIIGDFKLPSLGISPEDVDLLIKETTCVIHAAANVKFDQTLKEATYNVKGTYYVVELAKKMPNLKVFVFVSTAYSNCLHSHIKEEFYEPPMKAEKLFSLVDTLDDYISEVITPHLLKEWPNSYIFTKNISEDLIKHAGDDLPIVMIRPAIVTSSAAEPIPGWIDNFYGVVGVGVAAGLGIVRSANAKPSAIAALVPVDHVSNCILAAASKREKQNSTPIYNFAGDKRLTWGGYIQKMEIYGHKAYSMKTLWYYTFKIRENETWHKICVFFMHMVPAYIVDFIFLCLGRPRIAVSNYIRLNKMLDMISYFCTRSWTFDKDNVAELWNGMSDTDKKIFNFNSEQLDHDIYFCDTIFGGRKFLLKESPDTIPLATRKFRILTLAHYTFLALFYYLLYKFVLFLFGSFV